MAVVGYITQKTHNLFNNPVLGIINGIIYSLIFTVTYVADRLFYRSGKNFLSTLIFPSVYIVIETIISGFIGNAGILAQTQFSFKILAQLSTITGLSGISFIICWFASVIHWLIENEFRSQYLKKALIFYGGIFTLILIYGIIRTNLTSDTTQTVKVATVSGETDLHGLILREKDMFLELSKDPEMEIPDKFYSSKEDILRLTENTIKAAKSGAKIIVWSESALILNQKQVKDLINQIKEISKSYEVYILTAFFEENNTTDPKPINNKCVLITKDGNIAWEYKKSHPTPAEIPVVNPGNSDIPYFDSEYGRLGCLICYDLDFTALTNQANKKDIDILLVPAYDWESFAETHSKSANFESLQNGIAIIRANGNGINLITDKNGNIIAGLNTFTVKEKILYADLPIQSKTTIYSKTGNLFLIVCAMFLIFVILSGIINRRSNKNFH